MKIHLTDSGEQKKINCLIYGQSGAGKTSLVNTLVDYGFKPLVYSLESGLMPLQKNKIPYIDGSIDDDGKVIPKHLRLGKILDFYSFIQKEETKKSYDTIVTDSLSEVSSCIFDAVKKEYPENRDNMVAYGLIAQKTKDYLKAMRDCPGYNMVFIALSKVEKDQDGKRFATLDMVGSIADRVAGYVDEYLYLRINQEGQREILCQPTDSIQAKDRSGKLNAIEPPDLGLIFNKILGKNLNEKK